ncbi:dual oxidase 2-like [Anneissia japonica]|uniref:dual oxidase 2-like n=1 Tax=Anneissia japonica TaxID=1529436 RepID=UPI001425A6C1|nr:dual oxidase 2-like [Anneissia japonica]
MPFDRSQYDTTTGQSNPREQINAATPWIDGGVVYGSSKVWANALREYKGGRLAGESVDSIWPESNKDGLQMVIPTRTLQKYGYDSFFSKNV